MYILNVKIHPAEYFVGILISKAYLSFPSNILRTSINIVKVKVLVLSTTNHSESVPEYKTIHIRLFENKSSIVKWNR